MCPVLLVKLGSQPLWHLSFSRKYNCSCATLFYFIVHKKIRLPFIITAGTVTLQFTPPWMVVRSLFPRTYLSTDALFPYSLPGHAVSYRHITVFPACWHKHGWFCLILLFSVVFEFNLITGTSFVKFINYSYIWRQWVKFIICFHWKENTKFKYGRHISY